jgi:DNA-binding IclR family transcriptional regulator
MEEDIEWLRIEVTRRGVRRMAEKLGFPRPTVLSILAGLARYETIEKLAERRAGLELKA